MLAAAKYERLCKEEPNDTPTFVEHLLAIPKDGDFEFERWPLDARQVAL